MKNLVFNWGSKEIEHLEDSEKSIDPSVIEV